MQKNNNSASISEQVKQFISKNKTVKITIILATFAVIGCGYIAFSNSKSQSISVPTVTPTLDGQPASSLPPRETKTVSGVNFEGGISGKVGSITNSPNNSTNNNSNNNNSSNTNINNSTNNSNNNNSPNNSNNTNSNNRGTVINEHNYNITRQGRRPKFDKYRDNHTSSRNSSTEQTESQKTGRQKQPKDTQQPPNSTETAPSPPVTQTPESEPPKAPEKKAETSSCNVFVVYDPKDGYANFRSSPNNGQILAKINNGNIVNVELNQEVGNWSKVNFGSSSGYMKSNLLRKSTTHYVFDKNDTFANLRSTPSKDDGAVVERVKNGTPLTIISNTESDGWVQVSFNTDDQAVGYMSRARIADPSCAS